MLGAFERDTLHRLLTEAARMWVVGSYLSTRGGPSQRLPDKVACDVLPAGPVSMDWGAADVLRGRRVKITMELVDDATP